MARGLFVDLAPCRCVQGAKDALERSVVQGFLFRVLDCLAWQPMHTVNAFGPTVVAMLAASGVTAEDVMQ